MELERLKSYLKCAADMEMAIYACQQAIQKIDASLKKKTVFKEIPQPVFPAEPRPQIPYSVSAPSYPTRKLPAPPVKQEVKPLFRKEKSIKKKEKAGIIWTLIWMLIIAWGVFFCGGMVAIITAAFLGPLSWLLHFSINIPVFVVSYIITLIILIILYFSRRARLKDKYERQFENAMAKYEAEKAIAEKKYLEDLKRYEEEMILYKEKQASAQKEAEEQTIQMRKKWEKEKLAIENKHALMLQADKLVRTKDEKMRASLSQMRDQFNARANELKNKLDTFYNNGPVYSSFRNMVAVTQLYEYIASGIASELEGPNGAYSQYMLDVRTNKICESINQLRLVVVEGFQMTARIQYMLVTELQEANRHMSDIEYSLNGLHTDLSAHMERIYNEAAASEMQMQKMSSQLSKLHSTADSMVQNIKDISDSSHATAMNTAMIGFNQYLDMKARGIDGYYGTYGF